MEYLFGFLLTTSEGGAVIMGFSWLMGFITMGLLRPIPKTLKQT